MPPASICRVNGALIRQSVRMFRSVPVLAALISTVACVKPTVTFCMVANKATATLTTDVNGCPALDHIGPDELAAVGIFTSVSQCEQDLPNCTTADVTLANNYESCVGNIQPQTCEIDGGTYEIEVETCINGIMLRGFCGVAGNAPPDGGS